MKAQHIIGCICLVSTGIGGWHLGARLSPDALGMAVGFLFGILASIPAMLMILGSSQPRQRPEWEQQQPPLPKVVVDQPPQITVNNNHYYGDGKQTVDQLLQELEGTNDDWIEDIEWVRQLSTGSAPKRITTNQRSNSRRS